MDYKICIVSEYAYNCIKGDCKGAGGAEVQMALLAKYLNQQNYDVSFIVFSNAQKNEKIEGINVFIPYNNKNSGFAHFYPQNIFKLIYNLQKIDPDIIIHTPGSTVTGIISLYSKIWGKKFIFISSSDLNISEHLKLKSITDLLRLPYILGVKAADQIICQSKTQKNLLKKYTGIKGVIIKNIFYNDLNKKIDNKKKSIIWVGRIIKDKRPEIFLELAKKIPDYEFIMIGGSIKSEKDFYKYLEVESKKIDNLQFLGFISHNQISKYFMESAIFINTSPAEGFPNTFLEAWGAKTPISSIFFDPDKLIKKHNLGLYATNFNELVENTLKLMKNNDLRTQMGENAQKYVAENHNPDKIIEQYIELFEKLYK